MRRTKNGQKRTDGWFPYALAAAGCLAISAAASGQCWEAELIGDDSRWGDLLGWTVDLSADGGVAIAGAAGHDYTAWGTGAAYIFRRDSGEWIQEAKLLAEPVHGQDNFGFAVALRADGEQACVLDQQDSLYIFTKMGDEWLLTQKLALEVGLFPTAVFTADGNVLLVATDLGKLHIYARFGEDWLLQQTLEGGEHFGTSVAASHNGDTIAVEESHGSVVPGTISLYRRSSDDWQLDQVLSDPAPAEFGQAVVLSEDGSRLICSRRPLGEYNRIVWVYQQAGPFWTLAQEIESPDVWHRSSFGESLACSGDAGLLIVGNPSDNQVIDSGGSIYLYEMLDAKYQFVAKQLPPNNVLLAGFGHDIQLTPDGTRCIGGAPFGGRGQVDIPIGTGAAYILNTGDCALDTSGKGDLDGDFDVDVNDLGILLNAYEKSPEGDIDGDGDTDQHDLGILLKHYGRML